MSLLGDRPVMLYLLFLSHAVMFFVGWLFRSMISFDLRSLLAEAKVSISIARLRSLVIDAVKSGVARTLEGEIFLYDKALLRDYNGIVSFYVPSMDPRYRGSHYEEDIVERYQEAGFPAEFIKLYLNQYHENCPPYEEGCAVPAEQVRPLDATVAEEMDRQRFARADAAVDARALMVDARALLGSTDLERVRRLLSDNNPWKLRDLSERSGVPEATVSARIRDLRKKGFYITRDRADDGRTFSYTMAPGKA